MEDGRFGGCFMNPGRVWPAPGSAAPLPGSLPARSGDQHGQSHPGSGSLTPHSAAGRWSAQGREIVQLLPSPIPQLVAMWFPLRRAGIPAHSGPAEPPPPALRSEGAGGSRHGCGQRKAPIAEPRPALGLCSSSQPTPAICLALEDTHCIPEEAKHSFEGPGVIYFTVSGWFLRNVIHEWRAEISLLQFIWFPVIKCGTEGAGFPARSAVCVSARQRHSPRADGCQQPCRGEELREGQGQEGSQNISGKLLTSVNYTPVSLTAAALLEEPDVADSQRTLRACCSDPFPKTHQSPK